MKNFVKKNCKHIVTAAALVTMSGAVFGQWQTTGSLLDDASRGGKVGIGTSAPQRLLHLNQNLFVNHEDNCWYQDLVPAIRFTPKDPMGSSEECGPISPVRNWDIEATYDRMKFLEESNERLTIRSGGNVGIGYTTPNFRLSLGNALNNTKLALYENNGSDVYGLGIASAQFRLHVGSSAARFSFLNAPAGTEIVTIKGDGNVGIGEVAPVNLLDVAGGVAIGPGYAGASTAPSGGGLIVQGNTGIGTDDPQGRLHVTGEISIYELNDYDDPSGQWGYIGVNPGISDNQGFVYNDGNAAVEMSMNFNHDPEINWINSSGSGDITFNFKDEYQANSPTKTEIMRLMFTAGGDQIVNIGYGASPPTTDMLQVNGDIYANGNTYPSDIRFKKNINRIENALEVVKNLNGVSYEWRREDFPDRNFSEGFTNGVIAQELTKHVPNAVKEGKNGYLAVNYDAIIPILIEAIKEQQKQIEILKEEKASGHDGKRINHSFESPASVGHELFQNRPNPFSVSATIDYVLVKGFESAYIQVFEPNGRPLMKFEHLMEGKHSVDIHAGQLSSGLYMYALVVDGRVVGQKSMVIE